MKDKTIAIYIFIDDLLIKIGQKEPVGRKVLNSQIITTALVAGMFFNGHMENAISFTHSLFSHSLSKSRFNRRVHAVLELLINLFFGISQAVKQINIQSHYTIDSFPVSVCENIRINRSRIVQGKIYRGYKASKRQYFYGFTVQVIATVDGIPVEFVILPGSIHDCGAMKNMSFNLPEKSIVYGDSAYTDYWFEEMIKETEDISLMIARKSNSKRKHEPWQEFLISHYRKGIESVFSQITALFPKRIHAVTPEGFLLKLAIFIIAFTFQKTILI